MNGYESYKLRGVLPPPRGGGGLGMAEVLRAQSIYKALNGHGSKQSD